NSSGQPSNTIDTVVQRILGLMLASNNKLKTSITLFVGAGVSCEYGIPTTFGFAKQFFEDAISGIENSRREEISKLSSEEQIATFIQEFRSKLNSDLAYSFFKSLENKAINNPKVRDIVTYDRIVDLWASGYIKIVVTTNFDSLIEKAVKRKDEVPGGDFSITVLDYSDLARTNRPTLINTPTLLKVSGDIERSNMLWTEDEFEANINETVLGWLGRKVLDSPIILLGYTASEAPLARMLAEHQLYLASVDLRDLDDIPTLNALAKKRLPVNTDHAKGLAGKFVERIYEELYKRTKDPKLKFSFLYVKDKLERIEAQRTSPMETNMVIHRREILEQIWTFAHSIIPENRLTLMLGDPGYGKTVLVREISSKLSRSSEILTIYIPASELLEHTIDEWFTRVDTEQGALWSVCQLVTALDRSLLIIVDGLNEITYTRRVRSVLNNIISLLDQFDNGRVRCLVTCRSDYWIRLKYDFSRTYLGSSIIVRPFTRDEVLQSLDERVSSELRLSRYRWFVNLLRTPQTFGLFSLLVERKRSLMSEFEIYKVSLGQRLAKAEDAEGALVWICERFERTKMVNLNLIDTEVGERRRKTIQALVDIGILTINRFESVRFLGDRIGEFLFGSVYLYEYKWFEVSRAGGMPVDIFFLELIKTYNNLDSSVIEYKIHLLNSLIFFVARCDDDEVEKLYAHGDALSRTMIRAAIVQRRSVSVRDIWINDPLMMAAAFLTSDNFPRLREQMIKTDHRFFSEIPFNFTAKLFPEEFLNFIESYLGWIEQRKIILEEERQPASALFSAVVIFILRNGPIPILERSSVVTLILSLVNRTDPSFLADRLVEAVEENSGYLFYSRKLDKPSHLYEFEPYWQNCLREAIKGSVFDLSHGDLIGLINLHSMTRLILKFLFCRDVEDKRLNSWLEAVFQSDDASTQDFMLGVLGWAGKINDRFIPISEHYLTVMRENSPQNFYRQAIYQHESGKSQYDPLVPHVTTLLLQGDPVPIFSLVPDKHDKAAFRIARLAEKTILDFPDETLTFIYEVLGKNVRNNDMKTALRIAAGLYPMYFWIHARRNKPSDLFEISDEDITGLSRVIAQVRDFDWWNNLSFAIATEQRKAVLTQWMLRLVDAHTLNRFFKGLIQDIRAN
ncbi:MAG: NACHT domain-containing protein, partial [Nitrospirae bacterium]|nr:NACHT domain-containing protein [Magnetococcales bacterium]